MKNKRLTEFAQSLKVRRPDAAFIIEALNKIEREKECIKFPTKGGDRNKS